MMHWRFIELGGSSSQTAWRTPDGHFQFAPGVAWKPGQLVAVACPGLIRESRVWYASNLGWPEVADPAVELGIAPPRILVNDALAAALGEAALRGGAVLPELYYVALGTGVGSAQVQQGIAGDWNLGHTIIGGTAFCAGCRTVGCLNAYLAADCLPPHLSAADAHQIAQRLALALGRIAHDPTRPLVLAGGIGRRYPAIAAALASLIANPVLASAAPPEAKSAAYAGLDYLATQAEGSSV